MRRRLRTIYVIQKEQKQINNDFEKREKRVNIFFKVLYVLVAIWVTFLLNYANNFIINKPIQKETISILVALISGLMVLIVNIIRYIFNELKCMKINTENKEEIKYTDDMYSYLFSSIAFVVFVLSFLSVFAVNIFTLITNPYSYFIILTTIYILYLITTLTDKESLKKHFKVYYILNSILGSVMFFMLFYSPLIKK